MRYLLLLLFIGIITGSTVFAQEPLTDIKAPSSPAAALLGVQPQSVLAPKSNRALETAVYSNFLNTTFGVAIPNDFGLEFTPYWARNHSLSLEEYLYPEDIWQGQILRNSSFSVASTQKFTLGDSTATTGLAFGYRTTLHFSNQQDRERVAVFRKELSENMLIQASIGSEVYLIPEDTSVTSKIEFINTLRPVVRDAVQKVYGEYLTQEQVGEITEQIFQNAGMLPEYNRAYPDQFLNAFMNMVDTNLSTIRSEQNAEALFQNFKSYIRDRQGFSIDIAYGFFLNFPTRKFQSAAAPRHSIWITPTYGFKNALIGLKVMGVLRYEKYKTNYFKQYFPNSEIYKNNIDYGVAISGDFDRFTLEFEAVARNSNSLIPAGMDNSGNLLFRKDSKADFQAIGTFLYRLNEHIALSYSLGSRFEPIVNPENTLVSLLSFNLGFGGPTKDDIVQ